MGPVVRLIILRLGAKCIVMIVYKVGQGKIYAGHTALSSTLIISETGPLELTISAGSYTSTGDKELGIPPHTYNLTAAAVCPIFNTDDETKYYTAELVASQWAVEILWKSYFAFQPYPPYPAGFERVQLIVYPIAVPSYAQSIADIEINVLQVIPGFPTGIDGDNWDGIQRGSLRE